MQKLPKFNFNQRGFNAARTLPFHCKKVQLPCLHLTQPLKAPTNTLVRTWVQPRDRPKWAIKSTAWPHRQRPWKMLKFWRRSLRSKNPYFPCLFPALALLLSFKWPTATFFSRNILSTVDGAFVPISIPPYLVANLMDSQPTPKCSASHRVFEWIMICLLSFQPGWLPDFHSSMSKPWYTDGFSSKYVNKMTTIRIHPKTCFRWHKD